MSQPPSDIPLSVFENGALKFLDSLRPEERHRVQVYTLKLLSIIRTGEPNDVDQLRVLAKIESAISHSLLPVANAPKGPTVYGSPPPIK